MKVEIKEATFPRKAPEYCVVVLSDDGNQIFCPHPFTSYKPKAEIIAKAFQAFIDSGHEQEIVDAAELLP